MTKTDLPYITAGDLRTKSCAAARAAAHADPAVYTRTLAPTGSGFRHNFFEKLSPGLKNGPERRPLRFSTISTKNHLLKLNIDKVTAIRVTQITLSSGPPLYIYLVLNNLVFRLCV